MIYYIKVQYSTGEGYAIWKADLSDLDSIQDIMVFEHDPVHDECDERHLVDYSYSEWIDSFCIEESNDPTKIQVLTEDDMFMEAL